MDPLALPTHPPIYPPTPTGPTPYILASSPPKRRYLLIAKNNSDSDSDPPKHPSRPDEQLPPWLEGWLLSMPATAGDSRVKTPDHRPPIHLIASLLPIRTL